MQYNFTNVLFACGPGSSGSLSVESTVCDADIKHFLSQSNKSFDKTTDDDSVFPNQVNLKQTKREISKVKINLSVPKVPNLSDNVTLKDSTDNTGSI